MNVTFFMFILQFLEKKNQTILKFCRISFFCFQISKKNTDIYCKCLDKDDESFRYLVNANNKSNSLWKSYWKYAVKGYLMAQTLISVLSAVACLLIKGRLDPTILYRPYKLMSVSLR